MARVRDIPRFASLLGENGLACSGRFNVVAVATPGRWHRLEPDLGLADAPKRSYRVSMIASFLTPAALQALGEVIVIDLVLAGDNAVVVGALAAGLPYRQRRQVILVGIGAALVMRIAFALVATQLLQIVGLLFAGGLLLLWVSWRMWRELRAGNQQEEITTRPPKNFVAAAWSVAVADVSMSLDNVLGVAGAAREHPGILVFGLLFSVAMMGLAANLIAGVIERHRWIGFVGLVVILWVAARMIYEGVVNHETGLAAFI